MFIAYVNETDYGCDYTIACGKALFELKATTYDEAIVELKCRFVDYPNESEECEGYSYEDGLESIILYEVSNRTVLPIDEWFKEGQKQKREIVQRKILKVEQLQYERLKEKFGE